MFNFPARFILVPLLALAVLLGTGGPAGAYLSPSNHAVLTAGPDATHMPLSYTTVLPSAPGYIIGPGSVPDYLTSPNWAYSPPLTKFVDPLPGLCVPTAAAGWANCAAAAVGMNKNIPVAIPDIVTYPGSDYYELELVEFEEPMHSDLLLNPTRLRGYRQVGAATDTSGLAGASTACIDPILTPGVGERICTAADNLPFAASNKAHYLGPVIVAAKDRPVRIKFINKLPIGAAGNLFVPVDVTIMGAGSYDVAYDPITKQPIPNSGPGMFTQNRAELHLHGGRTPWISDGTPHQWITPAGETTTYPKGVSVEDVPDMPPGGPGEQTYYWTNQQSSRLMFYHDHAWGITRVNVYVGEAAGYVIRDDTEQALVTAGILPAAEIPLVIQDKTFVDAATIKETDPTWAWGTQPWNGEIPVNPAANWMTPVTGDLWWPHVYMPAQNPFDPTGIAPMGRWAYGPYFWPATQNEFQPVPNPYYDAACDPLTATDATPGWSAGFCQPPEIPSTPNPSWGAEAFLDTPLVNGTAYPVMEVDPKPYRLRMLNAAHDRFFNLSLFLAARNTSGTWAENSAAASLCSNTASDPTCTEVKMLPAVVHPGFPATWPADGRPGGVPDYATRGPDWIMIGTEGGFLPQPVIIPPQPVNWNTDVTTFNAGNVNTGSLILGPAERADVIVDFSQFAGQTLILYNDAPAPWPALDPHYDYYTDPALDNTGMGGAGPTLPGKGPNTRTIMQIRVKNGAGQPFNLTALENAFDPQLTGGNPADGVFRKSQDPIIAAQGDLNPTKDPALFEAFAFDDTYNAGAYQQDYSAYNKLYGTSFPSTFPNWGVAQINDTTISFYNPESGAVIANHPIMPKAIQDEQGETFDMFGRMRAGLGLQLLNQTAGAAGFVVQTYSDPSTEILEENGIQVWKVTHNGVDTHPIHFHLFDVQILNRVGWDGFARYPDPTELGWKDTIRISPLEDTVVALRPVTPRVPFGLPESIRPYNPATALGSMTELTPVDPATGQTRTLVPLTGAAWAGNEIISLDWEYVWHCHILSHEENDMMRPISFKFIETLPTAPAGVQATAAGTRINLTWTDPTSPANPATFGNPANEIAFSINRSEGGAPFVFLTNTLANATSFVDTDVAMGVTYLYQLSAYNAAGVATLASNIASATTPVVALTAPLDGATVVVPGTITLTAAASAATVSVAFYDGAALIGTALTAPFTVDWTTATAGSHTLTARANNGTTITASAPVTITVVEITAAPATLTVPVTGAGVGSNTLSWTGVAGASVNYELEQSTDAFGTAGTLVYSGPATSKLLTVHNSGSYDYRVRATDAGKGASAWTYAANSWVVDIPTTAPATLIVPASSITGTYTISWSASPTVGASYVLQESTNPGFAGTPAEFPLSVQSKIFTGKSNGSYYYRIKAINPPMTDSSWTSSASPMVVALPAAAPATVSVPATSTTGSFIVSWGASATPGATYTLEESSTANFAAGTVTVVEANLAVTSRTITGKTGGTWYYRVSAIAPGFSVSTATYGSTGCAVLLTVITTPGASASFPQGTPITINATATTPAGYTVSRVDFYASSTLIGSDTAAPFETTWTSAPLGAHNLIAVTTYASGTVSMSGLIAITVTGAQPVTLAMSPAGASFDMGITLNLTATPTAVVGKRIIVVEFYDNAIWLGYDAVAPYAYSWIPESGGARSLTAVVYYNDGTTSTSAALPVTINGTVGIVTTALASGAANVPHSQTMAGIGGTAPYTWKAFGLPAGLTLNPATGVLSGTPTSANIRAGSSYATFPVSLVMVDSSTPAVASASKVLFLRINQ